jgi:hypothetical protein
MRHLGRWGPAVPVLMALASLAAPVSARADFILTLEESGYAPLVVSDNGSGDQNSATGTITFRGTYGDFTVYTSLTGISNRTNPGTGTESDLQITDLAIRNNSAGVKSLTVLLSDSGFTFPGGTGSAMTLRSSIGGTFLGATLGDTFSFNSYATTPEPNGTTYSTSAQTFSFPGGVQSDFHNDASTDFTRGASYTLGNSSVFSLSAGGQLNTSGTTAVGGASGSGIASVPEPASLALGAVGFLMTGAWTRFRGSRKKV